MLREMSQCRNFTYKTYFGKGHVFHGVQCSVHSCRFRYRLTGVRWRKSDCSPAVLFCLKKNSRVKLILRPTALPTLFAALSYFLGKRGFLQGRGGVYQSFPRDFRLGVFAPEISISIYIYIRRCFPLRQARETRAAHHDKARNSCCASLQGPWLKLH